MTVLNGGSTSARSRLPDRAAGYWIIELEGGEVRSCRRRVRLDGDAGWSDQQGFGG